MDAIARGLMQTSGVEAYNGAFQALGRLLAVGTQEELQLLPQWACECKPPTVACCRRPTPHGTLRSRQSSLADLAEGPYLLVAMHLDAAGLCHADAACRSLRELNRAHGGPWSALGEQTFRGLELEGDGLFMAVELEGASQCASGMRKQVRVDWKGRYARFLVETQTFREPFAGTEISEVQQADEIAYSRCTLRTDLIASEPDGDVYMEVEVVANPDNVSLAIVDFEAGGCSSVTFSPDTGAVIRERKVCEAPRKVQGAYIQPLTTITPGRGFEGSMGVYLRNGHLAFFRRQAAGVDEDGKEVTLGPWESTGFVTDLSWAEGKRLTPCLAFRNEGGYQVRMVCVGAKPPWLPERSVAAYDESSWSSLNWDADQDFADE
mmetsp:Transcript_119117/g.362356  ORF Transcript_119117/g.362356 Transcript_119117/m.362356 type:complete len:378 (+) Transcript_119117:62-1195(+)